MTGTHIVPLNNFEFTSTEHILSLPLPLHKIADAHALIKVSGHQYHRLGGGYDLEIHF